MKTRKIGGLICVLALVSSLASVLVYDYVPAVLFIISAVVILLYSAYLKDERIQPHITINDWIFGHFPDVDELTQQNAQRRLDTLRYRYTDGPFKIRFLFNRRFDDSEIKDCKSDLKEIANQDS